jgi:hypothetical protein
MGGSWVFSNTKANKFELHTSLNSMPSGGNPMMNQDEISYISTRSDTTGKLEVSSSVNLGNGFSLKPEAFFMDNDLQKAHI